MRVETAVVMLMMSCSCLCDNFLLPKHVLDSPDPGTDGVETYVEFTEQSSSNTSLNSSNRISRFRRDDPKTIDCTKLDDSPADATIIKECVKDEKIDGSRQNITLSQLFFIAFLDTKKTINIPMVLHESQSERIRGQQLTELHNLSVFNNCYLDEVIFPKLTEVNNMTIVNNPRLNIVDLIELEKAKEFALINNTKNSESLQLKLDTLKTPYSVTISGNLKLTSLEMPSLAENPFLRITDNENLANINLPKLYKVESLLMIMNNGKLTKIDAPTLSKFGALTLSDNAALKEFALTSIDTIGDAAFILERNTALQNLAFPALADLKSTNISISDNSKLATVYLGDKGVTLKYKAEALTISRNPSLSKIVLGKLKDPSALENIAIYGNRKLKRAEIELQCPETATNCYTQECVFDEPITDLSELDGCLNIYGDLVLKSSVVENTKTSTIISKIQGNLTIVNSTLALKDLHFLENTVIVGDVYIETCSSRLIYSNFTWQVEGKLSFSSGDACAGNCTAYDLLVEKKDDCKVVYGEIQIGWEPYTEVDVRNFKVIEKIVGKVSFFNIFPDKDTTGPLEFTNLETIETPEGGRSIYMNSNNFYKEHPFPNLKSVINPNKFVLEITHNSFEIKIEDLFKWEEELTNKKFDPYEIFPFLPGPKLVTELIEIDEKSLNFDVDYDNNGGTSTFAASSLSIALLLF